MLPITRGELVLDSSGKVALHSEEFLATEEKPGLMSSSDKAKLDSVAGGAIDDKLDINSSNPVQNKVLTQIINSIKEKYLKSVSVINNKLTITDQDDNDVDFFGSIYSIVTDTTDGLVPKFDSVDGTIDNQAEDWILTNHKGNLGWYKLPLSTFAKNTTSIYIGDDVSESNASTTNGSTYLKFFENSTLKHKYKIQGSGSTVVTSDSDGNLNIYNPTTFASNQVDKLTDYVKGTSVESLQTTDTLNKALGKLECKADVTYNLVKGAYDGDGTIENLEEILKVLDGIKDTDTIQSIVGKYLPLSGGTMLGSITINHDATSSAQIIYKNNRQNDDQTGGWADNIIIHTNASGTPTARIGVLGDKQDLSYLFLGHNIYNATNNLRIYNDHASFGNNMMYNNYIAVPQIQIIGDTHPHIQGNNGILTLGGKNSQTEGSVVCDSENNAFRRNSYSTNITLGTNTYRWGNFFGTTGNFTGKITFPLNTGIYYDDQYGLLGVASKGQWTGHPGTDNDYTFVGTPSYDTILRAKGKLYSYRNKQLYEVLDSGNLSSITKLHNFYSERQTSLKPAIIGDGSMYQFKSTSTAGSQTDYPGDGHILHFEWDNNGGYSSQLFIQNHDGLLKIRGMNGKDADGNARWGNWIQMISTKDVLLKSRVLFEPNNTDIQPTTLNNSFLTAPISIARGLWSYGGNGYTSTPFGNIDLAGTTVIKVGANDSEFTQLFITPPTATEDKAIRGELLYYINNGSGYYPTWYRVLTNANYQNILPVKLVSTPTRQTLISNYGLPSDYETTGYKVEDYLKALTRYLLSIGKGHTCIGTLQPSVSGSYICYVYDTTIDSTTNLPKYFVGTAFLYNAQQVSFGTYTATDAAGVTATTWYYRTALNSSNYTNYTLNKFQSMQFTKTANGYVNASFLTDELKLAAADKYIEFWDTRPDGNENLTGWFNSKWGKIRTKFGYESESKISLLGTTADTSWISFSRTGEGANYITWPGESSASCLLAFGYGNQYAQSYYYMSNKALYPAQTSNTQTLGTSSNRWNNIFSKEGNYTGNLTLYSASGDSPHLVFQRANIDDGTWDWDQYVSGGVWYLRQNSVNNTPNKWQSIISASDTTVNIHKNLYIVGDTKLDGSLHKSTNATSGMSSYLASFNSTASSVTGAIKITLPTSWSSAMAMYEIKIYEYDSPAGSTLLVSGYNYSSGSYHNVKYTVVGEYNKGVSFAHDGANCCILLGNTTSTWKYPQIFLSNVYGGYSGGKSVLKSGYTISVLTDDSGLTKVTCPKAAIDATTATRLVRQTPLDASHTLYYYSGQPNIGTNANEAKEGSNAWNLFSYPAGGTPANTVANIMSLRMQWSTQFLHEIFASPNNRQLWHRWINQGTTKPWSRIVLENNDTESYTYNVDISGSAYRLKQLTYTNNNINTELTSEIGLRFYTVPSTVNGSAGKAGNEYGFDVSNNANGILDCNVHSSKFSGQIGISSNKNLYYRFISAGNYTNAQWVKLLTSDNYTSVLDNTYRNLNKSQWFGSESQSYYWIERCKEGGGGWAYSPMLVYKGDKTSTLLNIGVYGSANTLTHVYLGSGGFNAESNLRILSSGLVKINKLLVGATLNNKTTDSSGHIIGHTCLENNTHKILTLFRNDSANGAILEFKNSSGILGAIGMSGNGTNKSLLRWSSDYSTSWTIWDSGNHGHDSGLNADKLDGYHASSFMSFSNATNYVNASFIDSDIAKRAADTYIEFWDSGAGWFNSKWGTVTAATKFVGNLNGTSDSTQRFKLVISNSGDLNTALSSGGLARNYNSYMSDGFTNAPAGSQYGMVLQLTAFADSNALAGQLAWDVNHNSTTDTTRYLWWRAGDSVSGFTKSKWHKLAFADHVAPAGTIVMWAGATAPTGWLLCNGAAVSRTTYSSLFAVISTTYGSGNGSTTFNVPNLVQRFPLGADTQGQIGLDSSRNGYDTTLGKSGGSATHTLTVSELPSHRHSFTALRDNIRVSGKGADVNNTQGIQPSSGYTGYSGSNYAHNNIPPFLAVNFIIKY